MERLRRGTKAAKEAEKNASAEASRAREEVEKKSALVLRLREERAGSRASQDMLLKLVCIIWSHCDEAG